MKFLGDWEQILNNKSEKILDNIESSSFTLAQSDLFRHEIKYYINSVDYKILSTRLNTTLQRDSAADKNGNYTIRSLYFDDLYDSSVKEKIDGINERKKYRIRIYNNSPKQIKLECKQKVNRYIHKRSVEISKEIYDQLLQGNPTPLLSLGHPLANEMYLKYRCDFLRPKVIVEYVREAFVYPSENTRITFDKSLKTSYENYNLFDEFTPMYSAFDDPSTIVLEVKFNNYLPIHIQRLIQLGRATQSAISKYCICRKYE